MAAAIDHLHRSLELGPEFRMKSYGPSMLLARELCEHREWQHVAEYLKRCETFWSKDSVRRWISDVEQEQMPAFEPKRTEE